MKKLISILTAVLVMCTVFAVPASALEHYGYSNWSYYENMKIIEELPQEPFFYKYGEERLIVSNESALQKIRPPRSKSNPNYYYGFGPYFYWNGELYNSSTLRSYNNKGEITQVYSAVSLAYYEKKLLVYAKSTSSFCVEDFSDLNAYRLLKISPDEPYEKMTIVELQFKTYEDTFSAFKALKDNNRVEKAGIVYTPIGPVDQKLIARITPLEDDYLDNINKHLLPYGDTTTDNKVTTADLLCYLAYFQGKYTFDEPIYNNVADIDGDGVVNNKDYRLCAEKIFN
jgi:hypothetical protein